MNKDQQIDTLTKALSGLVKATSGVAGNKQEYSDALDALVATTREAEYEGYALTFKPVKNPDYDRRKKYGAGALETIPAGTWLKVYKRPGERALFDAIGLGDGFWQEQFPPLEIWANPQTFEDMPLRAQVATTWGGCGPYLFGLILDREMVTFDQLKSAYDEANAEEEE